MHECIKISVFILLSLYTQGITGVCTYMYRQLIKYNSQLVIKIYTYMSNV